MTQRYTRVAVALHWAIAAGIIFNLASGFIMEGFKGPSKHLIVSLHASSGVTVLALSLARIAWRLTHRPPPFDPHLTRLERILAESVHGLLYIAMIAMPLIGWAVSSASTRKVAGPEFWMLAPLPKLGFLTGLPLPQKVALHDQAVWLHQTGAWILLALLAGHILGALKHQFLDRQPQFARMWFAKG